MEEAAVRDLEKEKEANKPNLRIYHQNPNAEKYVKEEGDEDYGDEDWERASREIEYGVHSENEEIKENNLVNSEKSTIFVAKSNYTDMIKEALSEFNMTPTEAMIPILGSRNGGPVEVLDQATSRKEANDKAHKWQMELGSEWKVRFPKQVTSEEDGMAPAPAPAPTKEPTTKPGISEPATTPSRRSRPWKVPSINPGTAPKPKANGEG
jgi:hypothetical protein